MVRQQKEKNIQSTILKWLRQYGYFVWKWQVGGTYNARSGSFIPSTFKGAPDIAILHEGKFITFEVKTKTGRQTDSQKVFGDRIIKNGGYYSVVRSLEEVKNILENIKKQG